MATKAKKKKAAGIPKAVDFKSLTKTQRRVAIAEDVISALLAKRYVATCGTYVNSNATAKGVVDKVALREANAANPYGPGVQIEVQTALAQNMKSCEVCAKGAMFVAAVEKFDRLKIGVSDENDDVLAEFNGDSAVCEHLSNYFEQNQLDLIEAAFEGDDFLSEMGNFDGPDTDEQQDWVLNGYSHIYDKADVRMIAIMENVVRNNGKFVVSVEELLSPLATKFKK